MYKVRVTDMVTLLSPASPTGHLLNTSAMGHPYCSNSFEVKLFEQRKNYIYFIVTYDLQENEPEGSWEVGSS